MLMNNYYNNISISEMLFKIYNLIIKLIIIYFIDYMLLAFFLFSVSILIRYIAELAKKKFTIT